MMNSHTKIAINRDDGELLGFIVQDKFGWEAQTIFGYEIARANDQASATQIIRENGLSYLTGIWRYFDADDNDWFPCILKEVYTNRIIVIRTNTMGYQDPEDYKLVTIKEPSELNLVKT